jgi:hypothetical protein
VAYFDATSKTYPSRLLRFANEVFARSVISQRLPLAVVLNESRTKLVHRRTPTPLPLVVARSTLDQPSLASIKKKRECWARR